MRTKLEADMNSFARTAVFLLLGFLCCAKPALAETPAVEAWNILRRDGVKALAGIREDLYAPNVSVSGAGFQFIPFPGEVVNDSATLISIAGCRPQSCVEKGIAVIDKHDRRLQALGLRHFHCRLSVEAVAKQEQADAERGYLVSCDNRATLSIYIIRWNGSVSELSTERTAVDVIRKWAANFDFERESIRVVPVNDVSTPTRHFDGRAKTPFDPAVH